jgi:hypothetical protein
LVLTGFLLLQSGVRIWRFDYLLSRPDTRKQGLLWVKANIPFHSRVLLEGTFKPEYRSNLNIPLLLDIETVERRINEAKARGLEPRYLQFLKQAICKQEGYKILATPKVNVVYDVITNEVAEINDVSFYLDKGVEYIILTQWASGPAVAAEFYPSLRQHYRLVKKLMPNPSFAREPHFEKLDYKVLDQVNIMGRNLIQGPEIEIYKRKFADSK